MARPSDSFRNWLRHPDQPEAAMPPIAETQAHAEAHELKVPPDSDVSEAAIRLSMPQRARPLPTTDYTPDGAYIPLGGGLRGWYENSGVPNNEAPNHYRYREALHTNAFKATILERIETYNRRDSSRFKVDLWVKHSNPAHPDLKMTLRAYCMDLSLRGAKMRVREVLPENELIVISFFQQKADIENETPMATLQARVAHCHPAGGRADAPRFYVGVEFVDLEIAAKEALSRLMNTGTALVPNGQKR